MRMAAPSLREWAHHLQFPETEDRECHSARGRRGGGGSGGGGGEDSEDEEDLGAEETWEFSENDVHAAGGERDKEAQSEAWGAMVAKTMETMTGMKLAEVKKELSTRGIATMGFLEKGDFIRALAEAKVDEKWKERQKERAEAKQSPPPASSDARPASPPGGYAEGGAPANAFSTPKKAAPGERGATAGASGEEKQRNPAVYPKIFWLNTQHTRLHNVRAEPIKDSKIVGHLLANKQVLALAEAGDWLKVEWHRVYSTPSQQQTPVVMTEGCGWCLARTDTTEYVIEDEAGGVGNSGEGEADPEESDAGMSSAGPGYSSAEGEEEEELIYQLRDESGDLYYFNSTTGVSSWEPPEWIDSMDPVSGAVYFENTVTGETQWEKPFDFVPVVREEAYSTPEAQFIKSVLSPKRSRGPRSFYSPFDA